MLHRISSDAGFVLVRLDSPLAGLPLWLCPPEGLEVLSGAKPGAEAWLFLLPAGQRVSSYFTSPDRRPLTGKTGIMLPTP